MSHVLRAVRAATAGACVVAASPSAHAQQVLPEITITADRANRGGGTLTVPDTARATEEIQRTPGAVQVIPDTQFKNTPGINIKDVFGWVPGVVTQPKWGPDARVSIRGSGLTRNYGNRGISVYMDGIPINTADGLFDVFEIDPSAYRYVEVYKGANALRFGANSLGGAINFVTPTGRDADVVDGRIDGGSFGFARVQASTGGSKGPYDWFLTGSAQREDGYRQHSETDSQRFSGNFGYQFAQNAETRFYLNANSWRAQLPGELTKADALRRPRMADSEFLRQDQQRNIDSVRFANKTTLRFDTTTLDIGAFAVNRHVDHPIFRYLDFSVFDYGGFARATDERLIAGFRNRFIAGVNIHNGAIDYKEFANIGNATKGDLLFSSRDKSQNYSAYAENSFYVLPQLAVVTGAQFLHAVREREDRFLSNGDQSGRRSFDIFSPKVGLLYEVDPAWQVFANVSRSAEVPTFDVNTFAAPASTNVNAQTATTYEIGTRGRRPDFTWDLAVYRAELRKELQCLTTSPFSPCRVVNADRTVHQGVEAGLGVAFAKSVFAYDDRVWFNLAYTYNDFRFDGDARFGDNRLPGVPPHQLRAEVLYKHASGFYAGPNVEWMPRPFYADNANTLTVDPYALLNFRVGYDVGKGWSGYLEGRNLFNKRYISSTITAGQANVSSALFNPGVGLAVYGGLRYRM